MNILELAILKKMVGGGGGSGTDNYNDLSNLPQINGETLAGNKTAENLGLQGALTFDSTPTEDSTNPVESGGVYNALAGKQDNLTFDGVYNASTNKAATESTVTNAIAGLDVSEFSVDANETISSISETDGKVSVNKQDIAIASSQVVAMTGYTKPSSAPATPAIQQGDTANAAIGKLEYKADVNQSNILYAIDTGVKNLLTNTGANETSGNITFTHNSDGSILVNSTSGSHSNAFHSVHDEKIYLKAGTYVLSGCPSGGSATSYELRLYSNSTSTFVECKGTPVEFTLSSDNWIDSVFIRIDTTYNPSNMTFYPMICAKSVYDQDSSFMVGALPNYDLTRLEAEDRAALAEEIDAGAKNKVDIASVTTTGSSYVFNQLAINALPAGSYVFSYSSTQADSGDIQLVVMNDSATLASETITSKSGSNAIAFTINGTATKLTLYSVRAGTYSNFMVCTKAAFGVSQKFVPWRVPIKGVYVRDTAVACSTTLTTTGIKFTATEKAAYRITATAIYYNSIPMKVVIKYKTNSSANQLSFCAATHADGDDVSLIASGIMSLDVGGEFEVFAKYASPTSNYFYVLVEKIG